ncbi:MAG: hypothetical protein MZW92_24075 [Comamonadaceae bacterium]|nr:hypothetical protein [Comamonadaceae bacterium]
MPLSAAHDRTRQVLRTRRHRGPLGPGLGGQRRTSRRRWTRPSPRSASSCRRRTSPARCTWGTRSTRRSWTR